MKTFTHRRTLVHTFEYLSTKTEETALVEIYQLENGPFHFKILHHTLDNTRRQIAEGMGNFQSEAEAISKAEEILEKFWCAPGRDFADSDYVPSDL